MTIRFAAAAMLLSALAAAQQNDVLIQAMRDEMGRSRELALIAPDKPYLLRYSVEDAQIFVAVATLGGLLNATDNHLRLLSTRVRVGNYDFDNTNYVGSDYYGGVRYDSSQLPMENNYAALRNDLWLATDRAYKTALDGIARKRAALASVNLPDKMPDYTQAAPITLVEAVPMHPTSREAWEDRIRKVSGVFMGFPEVLESDAEIQVIQSADYIASTEGTLVRRPDDLAFVRIRAYGQAPDGMPLRDAETVLAFDAASLPVETELEQAAKSVAEETTALAQAPMGESWTGPVLFEPRAAAQLFAQVLGDNLKLVRKPIPQPGRSLPWIGSELEGRIGSRILPDWMDVVDDGTQSEWHGVTLLGHYEVDDEGVRPQPTILVDKGVLKTFLLTRTPPRPELASGSNGHARFPGAFGDELPGMSNLFVRASKTVPLADLKKQLIEICKQRGKPYGMLVRKLDFPSSASVEEIRELEAENMRSGGSGRAPVPPVLIYRVYLDGREELVRGLHFRDLDARSLRDIVAASDDSYVLNYLDSPVTFALQGASSFVAATSVIAPAVLFDELELVPASGETPRVPIVPPPLLARAQ